MISHVVVLNFQCRWRHVQALVDISCHLVDVVLTMVHYPQNDKVSAPGLLVVLLLVSGYSMSSHDSLTIRKLYQTFQRRNNRDAIFPAFSGFPDFFLSVQCKFEIHFSLFLIIILTFYCIPMPILSN